MKEQRRLQMNISKYLMILVFFILGCVAADGLGQERHNRKDFEQRKKVAEQVRDYRHKQVPFKEGAFPERTVNPRMENGYHLKPHPKQEYYRHRGIHPSVGYRPMITWLPEGTVMGVRGYVTPYRRRVILGGNFGFYGIQGVNTFNFRTGEYR